MDLNRQEFSPKSNGLLVVTDLAFFTSDWKQRLVIMKIVDPVPVGKLEDIGG